MHEVKNAGTAHSSAVTNVEEFDKLLKLISQKAGTAHSSAVTNIDDFTEILKSAKQ